jgi:hypothetical protein
MSFSFRPTPQGHGQPPKRSSAFIRRDDSLEGLSAQHFAAMTQVLLTVDAGQDANNAETAELTARLQEELGEHGFDAVALPSTAPPGAKGVGASDIAPILVALAASGGVLTTLLGMLQGWLVRNSGSQIEVEVDGDRIVLPADDETRQRVLDFFLARHEVGGGRGEESGGHAPR